MTYETFVKMNLEIELDEACECVDNFHAEYKVYSAALDCVRREEYMHYCKLRATHYADKALALSALIQTIKAAELAEFALNKVSTMFQDVAI